MSHYLPYSRRGIAAGDEGLGPLLVRELGCVTFRSATRTWLCVTAELVLESTGLVVAGARVRWGDGVVEARRGLIS